MIGVRRASRRVEGDGEGEGEGVNGAAGKGRGRCSVGGIGVDLEVGGMRGESSPSSVASALARMVRILRINRSVCRVPSRTNSTRELRCSRASAVKTGE